MDGRVSQTISGRKRPAGRAKPVRGRPRDPELPERRREQILDAASRLFAKKGYPNTDLQELADLLGVGKGTIYRYFPSKKDLFLACADWSMHRLTGTVNAVADTEPDTIAAMRTAIRAYLTFFDENPHFVELLIQERAEFKNRKQPTYFEHRERNVPRWNERWDDLLKQGRLRVKNVKSISDVVGSLLYGTIFTNLMAGRKKSLEEQADEITDIVLNGVMKPRSLSK